MRMHTEDIAIASNFPRYDESHQALLLMRTSDMQPVLFDGLQKKELLDAAMAVSVHLFEHLDLMMDLKDLTHADPVFGRCPKQYDNWSCGHRLILILKYIMEKCPDTVPLSEITVHDRDVNNKTIALLCGNVTEVKDEPVMAGFRSVKREVQTNSKNKSHPPAKRSKIEIQSCSKPVPEPIPNGDGEAVDQPPEPPLAPKVKVKAKAEQDTEMEKLAYLNGDLRTPPRPSKAKTNSMPPPLDKAKSEDEESDAESLRDTVHRFIKQRKDKRQEKKDLAEAKATLTRCKIDHNQTFQKAHVGLTMKLHWNNFLKVVAGYEPITCDVCESLILKHKVPVKSRGEAEEDDGDKEALVMKKDDEGEFLEGQIVPQDEIAYKSSFKRRGRPAKDSVKTFDLKKFISEERSGIYVWEGREEVKQILSPGSRQNEVKIEQELKKNPVRCVPCRSRLHFRYLTNERAFRSHENSREHVAALARWEEEGVPVEESCRGVLITSGRGAKTKLGFLADRVRDWAHLGCPAVLKSVLTELQVVSCHGFQNVSILNYFWSIIS